ncbi:MAG TPA: nucleoside deaminase [Mogibacterium sp.]|nr:nucleoside deaminase [Mogibacterium sp.]
MDFEKQDYRTEDEKYMMEAIREAEKAALLDEVPVGAVIVKDGKIIASAHNRVELDNNSSAHAEMIAIADAEAELGSKWLNGATVYVTLEPCCMCAGSMVLARISRLVIGAKDPKSGACGSVVNIVNNKNLNHRIEVTTGVLEEECSRQLTEFFRQKRDKE